MQVNMVEDVWTMNVTRALFYFEMIVEIRYLIQIKTKGRSNWKNNMVSTNNMRNLKEITITKQT